MQTFEKVSAVKLNRCITFAVFFNVSFVAGGIYSVIF